MLHNKNSIVCQIPIYFRQFLDHVEVELQGPGEYKSCFILRPHLVFVIAFKYANISQLHTTALLYGNIININLKNTYFSQFIEHLGLKFYLVSSH